MGLLDDLVRYVSDGEERTDERGVKPRSAYGSRNEHVDEQSLVQMLAAKLGETGIPAAVDDVSGDFGRGANRIAEAVHSFAAPNPDSDTFVHYRGIRDGEGTEDKEGTRRTDRSVVDDVLDVVDASYTGDEGTESSVGAMSFLDPVVDEIGARAAQVQDIGQGRMPRDYDSARAEISGMLKEDAEAEPTADKVGTLGRYAALIGSGFASPATVGGLAKTGALTAALSAAAESDASVESDPETLAKEVGVAGGTGALTGALLAKLGLRDFKKMPSLGKTVSDAVGRAGLGALGGYGYGLWKGTDPIESAKLGAGAGAASVALPALSNLGNNTATAAARLLAGGTVPALSMLEGETVAQMGDLHREAEVANAQADAREQELAEQHSKLDSVESVELPRPEIEFAELEEPEPSEEQTVEYFEFEPGDAATR